MEEYGFIYLWYDRKRKMFYIGCHWGQEDDGYLCSSNRMRDAYRRRPGDFKRRILSRIYTNREDLLDEEHRWFQFIKPEELGKKYYNIRKHKWGHWSTDKEKRLSVSEKMKGDNPMKRPEVVAKRLKTYMKGNHSVWNKGLKKSNDVRIKTIGENRSKYLSGDNSPMKGKKLLSITNGIENRKLDITKENKEIPEGFWKGQTRSKNPWDNPEYVEKQMLSRSKVNKKQKGERISIAKRGKIPCNKGKQKDRTITC